MTWLAISSHPWLMGTIFRPIVHRLIIIIFLSQILMRDRTQQRQRDRVDLIRVDMILYRLGVMLSLPVDLLVCLLLIAVLYHLSFHTLLLLILLLKTICGAVTLHCSKWIFTGVRYPNNKNFSRHEVSHFYVYQVNQLHVFLF